jgi:hypothetical protein
VTHLSCIYGSSESLYLLFDWNRRVLAARVILCLSKHWNITANKTRRINTLGHTEQNTKQGREHKIETDQANVSGKGRCNPHPASANCTWNHDDIQKLAKDHLMTVAGQITNMGKGKPKCPEINHLSSIAPVMFCESSAVGPPRIHVI